MPDNRSSGILAELDNANALARSWQHVEREELAALLRSMPSKPRNRLLSANRTPSSKVSGTTARLLVTNVARRGPRERLRVASVITDPLVLDAGDAVEDAAHHGDAAMASLVKFVTEQAADYGSTVVVLAAVVGTYSEPERLVPFFVACGRAGLLPAELETVSDALMPTAEEMLAAAGTEVADADRTLTARWQAAIAAAGRVRAVVGDGTVPNADDLATIDAYARVLLVEAERLGVACTVEAIEAALAAGDRVTALRGLAGPDALGDDIAQLRAATDRISADTALADRLACFARLVAESDPMARFALAGELRQLPPPPSASLIDAALAGLLTLEAPSDDAGHTSAGSESVDGAEHGQIRNVSVEDAADGKEYQASDELGPSVADGGTIATADTAPLETVDGSEAVDRSAIGSDTDVATSAGPVAGDGAARLDGGNAAQSSPREPWLAATPERTAPELAAAGADEIPTTRGAASAQKAPTAEEAAPAESQPSDDDIAATLFEVVAASRFGLAHHLAAVIGQAYRAAILAEAALAHVVRSTSSPAAAEMVIRSASTPLNSVDIGSVVLRAASTIRVALLDPASGAPALLRQLIAPLDALPRLRELAVAVRTATEQNLAVPAIGLTFNAAQAIEQAQAIASWAEDTRSRPPRHNRLFRGVEIWKDWTAPTGPLGRILAAVASNDPARVDEVRNLCAPLARRQERERRIDVADRDLRRGRAGTAQRITGPAREQLIRNVTEIVEQAIAWCDSHDGAAGDGWSSNLRADLATTAARLRGPVVDELGRLVDDDWVTAAARAAADSISASLGLLGNEPLPRSELDPVAALNRGLALVDGLPLDADLQPLATPTAGQLTAAARRSRREAFEIRVAALDFIAAEAIVDLDVGPDVGFDEGEARRRLALVEREARARIIERWRALDRRFAAARARGRVGEDDAARLYGELLQAQPDSTDAGARRDLGVVARELTAVDAGIGEAVARRREVLQADVSAAITEGAVSDAWAVKLRDLLEREELGAAEEYLHRALAGGEPPNDAGKLVDHRLDLSDIVAGWPDGADPAVVEATASGVACGPVDFAGVTEIARSAVADALDSWFTLSRGPRPEDLDGTLRPVLRLLGLIPTTLSRSTELRAASTRGRWFVDVHGDKSGYAFVPDYGSRSQSRRRFMLCWEDLPVTQLWDLAAANAPADQPVHVLWMGMLSEQARVELAREARRRRSGDVVVIDDAVIIRCAAVGRQAWDVTMRLVLPYAAPNPYDPDLLVNTPEEMFYGRRAEQQRIAQPAGTSFISGGRRQGKSALLRSVQQSLDGTDVVALLIVIQHVAAVPPNDPAELWPLLASRLIEADVLPSDAKGSGEAVSAGIRAWLAANPERRLLLLLDECDFFLRADAGSRFRNVVLLRDLMGDAGGRFKVVFSGLQQVARYRKLPNQPLSHLPQPLVIGPLDPSAASDLVRRPLHAMGWQVTDAQIDRIVTFCACNPSVLQLACGQLVDRLRSLPTEAMAPWSVPDEALNELLRSSELERGVRDRLFLTLELDHRYKLLAYLLAFRAVTEGLGASVSPAELRRQAVEYWPEGFAGQNPDDIRALCDELVGLGVFAGDAEAGYRMLSPATVRLFGSSEDIDDELLSASEMYEPDATAGAAGSRMGLGEGRFSPLTAAQLADVVGAGRTQLRVVVGSRALRMESVPEALAAAARNLPGASTREVTSLRQWRDGMVAPREGHLVVVADMTVGRSTESWEQSIDAARRRGSARTVRGTRAAVLVAGPSERWLLSRLVAAGDRRGDLADVTVGLRRIDLASLRAWDRIEELDLAHPARQHRLLEVTGGWPMLVERIVARMRQRPFDEALDELAAYLTTAVGSRELVAAVGLDPDDPDQPGDAGLVAAFARLAEMGGREPAGDLSDLLALDDGLGVDDPAEAVAILWLLGALDEDEDGRLGVEATLAGCVTRVAPALTP